MAKEMGSLRGKTFKRLGISKVKEKSLKVNTIGLHKVINFL